MLRLDSGVDWRLVDGEVLALDLGSEQYLGVNAMGALLWRELAAGVAQDTLVARLAAAGGISAARAQADVAAFLQQLRERRLLVEVPGRDGP
jgi:hypothetical protein